MAGRNPGPQPHLKQFPGILAVIRLSWSRMKAQAKFRNEPWDLSWDDYLAIWEGRWHLRGVIKDSLCLTRRDWSKGWTRDNVEITTRNEHWSRQGRERPSKKGMKYGPRKSKISA